MTIMQERDYSRDSKKSRHSAIIRLISDKAIETQGQLTDYLIKEGFIKRTPRGREVTDLAYKHLGRSRFNNGEQGTLF